MKYHRTRIVQAEERNAAMKTTLTLDKLLLTSIHFILIYFVCCFHFHHLNI